MPYTKFCIFISGFHKMIFLSVIITNKFEDIKGAIEKDGRFNGYKKDTKPKQWSTKDYMENKAHEPH